MTPRIVKPTPIMSSYRPRKKVTEPKPLVSQDFEDGFHWGIAVCSGIAVLVLLLIKYVV